MQGWEWLCAEGAMARWQALCAADAPLARMLPGAQARFAFVQPGFATTLALHDGTLRIAPGDDAALRFFAGADTWSQALQRMPPRHHHNLFAMRMRVPGFAAEGDELAWMQHAHILRRALDLARWAAAGEAGPAPESLRPSAGPAPCPQARGRYVRLADSTVLYTEQHGGGRPILCLHTAGADSRQFHRLAADARLAGYSLVAFDMPGHGKSPPLAAPGAWALDTERYCALILGFLDAWGPAEKPVLLGASMSGEICLEMALRAPERFAHIIACEATDHIPGRRTPWPLHPRVNGMVFTPEWVDGLMAPQSPAECAAEVWWHYSQGGYGTFPGDILFYSGGWDARDRVHRIDTQRCPLTMLTGEYDYSCTAEASAETAAKIKGARFRRMDGIGHFPFAENPALFAEFLLPELRGA
ncbi:MAG: alpha/beta fold hydrolase [Alphaproteobacteria bacterium]|jgi:pimeloyl-ACP methyl ester carboxylesterase|nr:alpha/beta fold hydrolase [Alphaproteobacteria bacterium]